MRQKFLVAQGQYENAKEMLKEEKERTFKEQQQMREKHQQQRMELDQRFDEVKLELNKKDDMIRRLEFEVEKSSKVAQVQIQSKQSMMISQDELLQGLNLSDGASSKDLK